MLSHGTWQTRYGGDPSVVGKTIKTDGITRRILGVMPPGFWIEPWNADVAFWVCYEISHDPQSRWMNKVGRLKLGVTPAYAEAVLTPLVRNLEDAEGGSADGLSARVEPLREGYLGRFEPILFFLSGAVGFVLLIACVNLAGLLTARGLGRRKELTLRASLGAGRGRLVRQLLIESSILALIGGAAGLFITLGGVKLFAALAPDWFPRAGDINIDLNVLTFVFVVSVVSGLLFGAIPAWRTSRVDLHQSLQEGGRSSHSASVSRSRSFLLASEVALAMVLLVGVSFMVRGLARELYSDPGVRTEETLQADIALGGKRYWNNFATPKGFVFRATPQVTPYYRRLLEGARAIPGIEGAAITTYLPQQAWQSVSFTVLGRPDPPEGEEPRIACLEVDSELLQLLDIPVLRGRGIGEQDTEAAAWVAVVNETFANRYFPDEDPLGRDIRLQLGRTTSNTTIREPRPRRIVGIVADVRKPHFADRQPAVIYTSYQQYAPEYGAGGLHRIHTAKKLLVRSSLEPASVVSPLRHVAAQIDPDQALFNVSTLEEVLEAPLAGQRFIVQIVSIFGLLALALAAVGIYGVSSYTVNARRQEFGIRRALGAQAADLRRLSLWQVLRPALLGMAMGLGGFFALRKVLEAMPFVFPSNEIGTFLIACLVMLAVVLAAGFLPARRAAKADPLTALRYE